VCGRNGERRSRVCEDDGSLPGRRSAGHGRARRLPDACRNGCSGLPRGAVRERRLAVPTHSSGAMAQTLALCRTGSAPGERKTGRVGRAAHRLAPFSSGGWNPRFWLFTDPARRHGSALRQAPGCE
jgi:hypothetical protein